MFYTSAEHKARFFTALYGIEKIYDGKLDPEYGSALYILTASQGTWIKADGYVHQDGINFETMLSREDFSSGYTILVKLAGNLFNGLTHIDPVEFTWLDGSNFKVALAALELRYSSHHIDDL